MEEHYKGHNIVASAWHLTDTDRWEPRVRISWTVLTGKLALATPNILRTFRTQAQAERKALRFAKKWIDDGKPALAAKPKAAR
jgi:hypothetical protein